MALMALWYWLARRYYRSRFGWQKPKFVPFPKSPLFPVLSLCLLVYMCYCLATGSFAWGPYFITFFSLRSLLDAGNPRIRRTYYAAGSALLAKKNRSKRETT